MNDQAKENDFSLEEWTFPNVENIEDFSLFMDENDEINPPVDPLQTEKDAYAALAAELEKTRAEFNTKIALLNNALAQIENYATDIDEDFTDILKDIISAVSTKLIYKEIKADPKLIKKIILELKKMIQGKKGIVNVFLSEEDFNALKNENEKLKTTTVLNIDPKLQCGDVILKNNTTEIRAILQERIAKLMC